MLKGLGRFAGIPWNGWPALVAMIRLGTPGSSHWSLIHLGLTGKGSIP